MKAKANKPNRSSKTINKRCFPQLTATEKQNIISLVLKGVSFREIERKEFCSHSTAQRIFLKWRNSRSIKRKKGSGRNRKTSHKQDDMIEQISEMDRSKVSMQIKDELNQKGVQISARTIRRRLVERGLHGRVAAKKPFLSERNILKRFQWGIKHEVKRIQLQDYGLACTISRFESH
jgi:transposase